MEAEAVMPPADLNAPNRVTDAPPSISLPPIVSKLPTNNARFLNLISRFIMRLHEKLDSVEQSRLQGQREDIAAFAHWLKGAGGSIGFDALTEPAIRLEKLAKSGDPDADIQSAIRDLRELAARLVDPGKEPSEASPVAVDTTQQTTMANEEQGLPSLPKAVKPLTSRLENNPRLHGVICRFIDKLREELKRAESALVKGDLSELAQIAHWLKGAGGTVGFDAFTAPAARLDTLAKSEQAEQAAQVLNDIKSLSDNILAPSVTQDQDESGSPIERLSSAGIN